MIRTENLKGIIVPVVTPLNGNNKVDKDSVEKITNYLIDGNVSALFVLGTTGEFAMFDRKEKCKIVEAFCIANNGRLPLLVNISEEGTEKSLGFYREIQSLSIDAVVLTAPYYCKISEDKSMLRHFMHIADQIDVPMLAYNMPNLTGNMITPPVVVECSKHKRIIGIKDSSSDLKYFYSIINMTLQEEFLAFQGNELLLSASLVGGASGGICTLANLAPQYCSGLYNSYLEEDFPTQIMLQRKLNAVFQLYRIGESVIPVLKSALAQLELIQDYSLIPGYPVNEKEKMQIRHLLHEIGLLG